MGNCSAHYWVNSENGTVPLLYISAGKDDKNRDLCIVRAKVGDSLVNGMLPLGESKACIPWMGKEIRVAKYQVLCSFVDFYKWVPASKGGIPDGAVKARTGRTNEPEVYYVARVRSPEGGYLCGRVHPSHQCCYAPFQGKEQRFQEYHVLVEHPKVPNEKDVIMVKTEKEEEPAEIPNLSSYWTDLDFYKAQANFYKSRHPKINSDFRKNPAELLLCKICCDSNIQTMFNCGHGTCLECSGRLQTCPICRKTIASRMRIFEFAT